MISNTTNRLQEELLDSRFGAQASRHIAESTHFPLKEMREDIAFQIISDELF